MTMTYFFHDSIDSELSFDPRETTQYDSFTPTAPVREDFHILREKLVAPEFEQLIKRPRLAEMLEKSRRQFSATLITGRSGTGKTALAASFAERFKNVAWYSVESADTDWSVFSNYFSSSITNENGYRPRMNDGEPSQATLAQYLVDIFAKVENDPKIQPSLIVLDDIHRIFDAEWFGEFFHLLLFSLPEKTHLLLLSRTKPPGPIWRLRSKQVLNVIDEKLLAFNLDETEELFKNTNIPPKFARKAHAESFGRLSKLIQTGNRIAAK